MGELTLKKRNASQVKALAVRLIDTNENLKKAIYSKKNDFSLEQDVPSSFEMLGENIFDYRYILDPEEDKKTILTMYVSIRPNTEQTNSGTITFFVITDKALMRTGYDFNRNDFIVSELIDLFDKRESNTVVKKFNYSGEDESQPYSNFIVQWVSFDFESFRYQDGENIEYVEDQI